MAKPKPTAKCTTCNGWGFLPDQNPMVMCQCTKAWDAYNGRKPTPPREPPEGTTPNRFGFTGASLHAAD